MFDQRPAPEDLEADPDDEGEAADLYCEGIVTDDFPEHGADPKGFPHPGQLR